MDTNHLVGGAVGIGLITAFWNKIQFLGTRIFSLFVVRVHVESFVAKALSLYCWTKMRRSPFGERRYNSEIEFVRSLSRYQKIAFEEIGKDPIVFWQGWRPLLIGQTASDAKGGDEPKFGDRGTKITMTFFRFMFDPDKLLIDAIDLLNERYEKGVKTNRYAVYRVFGSNNGEGGLMERDPTTKETTEDSRFALGDKHILKWEPDDLGPINERDDALGALALPEDAEEMIREAKFWKESEEWYYEHKIPWRRGWLLHGAPGTGKTSLIRAIGQELDLPVFVFDLATLTNRSLQIEWRKVMNWVPCIALFEDIDSVFHGRENMVRTDVLGGITFDCLLNCMDGIETANGVFVAVTTNDITKVDPALGASITEENDLPPRPGRIDRVLEMGPLGLEARRKLALRILSDCPEEIPRAVETGDGDTGACFEERCGRIARAKYWNEPEVEGEIVERPRLMMSLGDLQEDDEEAHPAPSAPCEEGNVVTTGRDPVARLRRKLRARRLNP